MTEKKPLIGISSCLLGNEVRYNGGHKRDRFVTDQLSKWVEFHSVCPELEMGLGVPREAVNLHRANAKSGLEMITVKTGKNLTALAHKTSTRLIKNLPNEICGYIFKKDSPSCGLERVKVYSKGPVPERVGRGLYAEALCSEFSHLPVIEEGRLSDPDQCEHFLTQVFALWRLRESFAKSKASMAGLQEIHRRSKYLVLSHTTVGYSRLGRLVGNAEKLSAKVVWAQYEILLMQSLKTPSTVKKRVNVLQHSLGFLKDRLDSKEKRSVLKVFERYAAEKTSWDAAKTLLLHLLEKHEVHYLIDQFVFEPFPEEFSGA